MTNDDEPLCDLITICYNEGVYLEDFQEWLHYFPLQMYYNRRRTGRKFKTYRTYRKSNKSKAKSYYRATDSHAVMIASHF